MTTRWDRHFLKLALDNAAMSKDPNTSVGAIIVGPDREIRSAGFNGLPRGIADTHERLNDRELKLRLIVHAEMNAILNAARVGISTKSCTMYMAATDVSGVCWGGAPCTRCLIHMIQAGISCVVTYPMKTAPSRWADDIAMSRELIREAGIAYREVSVDGREIPVVRSGDVGIQSGIARPGETIVFKRPFLETPIAQVTGATEQLMRPTLTEFTIPSDLEGDVEWLVRGVMT